MYVIISYRECFLYYCALNFDFMPLSLLGFIIYFAYGIRHSSEGKNNSPEKFEPILQAKKPIYLTEDDSEHERATP